MDEIIFDNERLNTPLHIIIISWTNKHGNALEISHIMKKEGFKCTIIYSDIDQSYVIDDSHRSIKTDNSLFFGDKFNTAIKTLSNQENMLLIHADTYCVDWVKLVRRGNSILQVYT